MPMRPHTASRHVSAGHWRSETSMRHVSSTSRHHRGRPGHPGSPGGASGQRGSGVSALLVVAGLIWAAADLARHAHQHHQPVIAFIAHAVSGWLS